MYPVFVGVGNVPYSELYVTVFVAFLFESVNVHPVVVGIVPLLESAVTVYVSAPHPAVKVTTPDDLLDKFLK